MQNMRLFEIKYLGPTNCKGSRFKITDSRYSKTVTIPWDYSFDSCNEVARDYLQSRDIKCLYGAEKENSSTCYIITNDFSTQIK